MFTHPPLKKVTFTLALAFNLLFLGYFKYATFFIQTLDWLFHLNLLAVKVALPIGISFYTFQAMSYIFDVYHNRYKPACKILDFFIYLSLFPQLIAGPIVRYDEINLNKPDISIHHVSKGIEYFIIGLSKKVLLADSLALAISKLTFDSVLSLWLSAIYFMLEIYFDFSGYSDMAVGLGYMLGFSFPKNFHQPYQAKSIKEFWRRWHMSLSRWFRDYVYIPLGGNRKGFVSWIINMLIVWALTGLWHGASWNFVLWGLYFAILLILEKLFLSSFIDKHPLFGHFYTLLAVLISFVIFRCTDFSILQDRLKGMFFLNGLPIYDQASLFYMRDYGGVTLCSIIICTPFLSYVKSFLLTHHYFDRWLKIKPYVLLVIFVVSIAFLVDQSYSPFLYFRF